jgi:MFS superfamily sulfate permease-like transporter
VEQSGGRSQVSGLAAALMVLLLAAFGAGLLRHVPEAALAGVLMFVASRIVNLRVFVALARTTPAEFALALAALALIVVLPIQTGVAVGIILSLIHGVFTITRARPIVFERRIGTTIWWPRSSLQPGESAPFVLVMGYQAPLSFLNAYEFRRGLLDAVAQGRGSVRLLVLETSSMVEIDFTAAGVMVEVIAKARAAGMDFAIARLESTRAEAALKRFGVIKALGPDHVFQSVEEAVRTLSPAVSGSAAKSPKAAP